MGIVVGCGGVLVEVRSHDSGRRGRCCCRSDGYVLVIIRVERSQTSLWSYVTVGWLEEVSEGFDVEISGRHRRMGTSDHMNRNAQSFTMRADLFS